MLSKRDIEKELGKGLAIVPFNESNIKDNSINLTVSQFAWGTVDWDYYYNSKKDEDSVYLDDSEIPEHKRKNYKKRHIGCGQSVVINKGKQKIILLFPHSTTYVETLEVLSTGDNIGGTCHSKVGTASIGIGHIGTMMGPNYSGNCFVPLHNPTNKLICLPVGETFMSVVFNYLDTPMKEANVTTGGHTDKFSNLKIKATDLEIRELNQDWKRSHNEVLDKMKKDMEYIKFKKRLNARKVSVLFSKKNVIFCFALIVLAFLASYIDGISGNTVWSDRFWTVMGAGVFIYLLQTFSIFR